MSKHKKNPNQTRKPKTQKSPTTKKNNPKLHEAVNIQLCFRGDKEHRTNANLIILVVSDGQFFPNTNHVLGYTVVRRHQTG